MSAEFNRVDACSPTYNKVKQLFYDGWLDSNKTCHIESVYFVNLERDRSGGGPHYLSGLITSLERASTEPFKALQLRFHGTRRACFIGDRGHSLQPCDSDECYLCQRLWALSKPGITDKSCTSDPEIYMTNVSSRADNDAMNHFVRSRLHAMIVYAIAVGNDQTPTITECNRIQYSEVVNTSRQLVPSRPIASSDRRNAYTEEATATGGEGTENGVAVPGQDVAIPVGLIMYTRDGWKPS